MIYGLLGIALIVLALCVFISFLLYDIEMELIEIKVGTTITKNIVTNWAIYYVIEEWHKGNNVPFDFIFPNDREIMEEQMKQEECHIDK